MIEQELNTLLAEYINGDDGIFSTIAHQITHHDNPTHLVALIYLVGAENVDNPHLGLNDAGFCERMYRHNKESIDRLPLDLFPRSTTQQRIWAAHDYFIHQVQNELISRL